MKKNKSAHVVAAVDLGGTNLRAALVDDKGRILARKATPTDPSRSVKKIVQQAANLVQALVDGDGTGRQKILGVGVGVPGFFSNAGEKILHSPNFPGWKKVSLRKLLFKKIRKPIALENDANCAAIGECWKGKGTGRKNVVCLTIGTGVGGGILVDGKLLHGTHGAAGELGHINVEPQGAPCGCGSRGCLEALVSGTALLRETGRTPAELFNLARQNNPAALETFEEMGRRLGLALASISYLFDPEIILLGGQVSGAFSFFSPAMKEEYLSRLKNHPARKVKIVRAKLGDDAGLVGAAALILNQPK